MLIDLFSLCVLFSHLRTRGAALANSLFQTSSYARANVHMTREKNKRKFPWEHHVVCKGKTKPTRLLKGQLGLDLHSISQLVVSLFNFLIDLFSLYVLFSRFRPRDALMGICLLFFSLIMRTFARAWDDIGKKLFPRVASRGVKWENKTYKLKRSINYVLTPLFPWHSPVLQGHNVPIWQRTGRPRNHWALCWEQDLSSSSYKGRPIFFRWPVLRDIRKYLKEV